MNDYSFITKNFLIEHYITKKLSMESIAKMYNSSLHLIRNRLIKFKIPIRNRLEHFKGKKQSKEHLEKRIKNIIKWTEEKIIKKCNEILISDNNYIFLKIENYNKWKSTIKLFCKKCNDGWIMKFSDFIDGCRCRNCNNKRLKKGINKKYNYAYVLNYINKYGYKLLSNNFITVIIKLKIQCNKGHIYYQNFSKFLNGHRCPKCLFSKGENTIEKYLKYNNIKYITQKTFNKCRNPKTNYHLYFDFYLPKKNLLIEYDGLQHFKSTGWHNIQSLKERKYKDNIKTQFAKDYNIKLLRIPYWDFNIIKKILLKNINIII